MWPTQPTRVAPQTSGEIHPMRAIVTCECCGHRQTVARPIRRPESFYLVCHDCERSLRVEVTEDDIRAAQTGLATAPTRVA